jgi:hypothetical protein
LTVASQTVGHYVLDVAKFCIRFNDRDPRKTDATQREMAEPLKAVLAELARYDKMPDRREPYTLEMWKELHAYVQAMPVEQRKDSREAACCDWFGSGLYGGYRRSEWAQSARNYPLEKPQKNLYGDPTAFCIEDVTFFVRNRVPVEPAFALSQRDQVERASTTYRTQKNGTNGEKELSTRNSESAEYCNIKLLLSIVERFVRLVGDRKDIPLAVYKHESGETRYLTEDDITSIMRSNAARTYKLDPKKDRKTLQKWSAHSLRVGACVILHAMGFTESQIQFLLRWRSTAFMCYLRNLAILSIQQNQAITTIETLPNFIKKHLFETPTRPYKSSCVSFFFSLLFFFSGFMPLLRYGHSLRSL